MTPELANKLIEKYPEQFKNLTYIECGDGWYTLLDTLCNVIKYRIKNRESQSKPLDFYWSQIKEKFGGLRAYCYGSDEYIQGAICLAETMSFSTCEVSGDKGRPRNQKIGDNGEIIRAGWILTLSDEEAKKAGYA
jgi:hypothetical protein